MIAQNTFQNNTENSKVEKLDEKCNYFKDVQYFCNRVGHNTNNNSYESNYDLAFSHCLLPQESEVVNGGNFGGDTRNWALQSQILKKQLKKNCSSLPLMDVSSFKHNNNYFPYINSSKLLSKFFFSNLYRKIKNMTSFKNNFMRKSNWYSKRRKSATIPTLRSTSFFTILAFICLETILLSTMSTCAKTFYMHWNTSNSIFRIDNTDHIIDVNKGNLAFEFDQVHIICPVYEPGTFENETEKYIIYNVSKVEYETCRITNADPRVIAICDKPHKLMFFTITFRPFTPQPGGLEFLPGNDYYFISTSSKDDLYRRIGGRCSTNNMKVVFKVCCVSEEKNHTTSDIIKSINHNSAGEENKSHIFNSNVENSASINFKTSNALNSGLLPNGLSNSNTETNNVNIKPINTIKDTSVDQFNRIPIQPIGVNSGMSFGNHGISGILLTPGHGGINMIPNSGISGGQYAGHGQGGIRINNIPPQPHYPPHKSANDDHFEKHPNEVVKNEELTYNSGTSSLHLGSFASVKLCGFLINELLNTLLKICQYIKYCILCLFLKYCICRDLILLLTFATIVYQLHIWKYIINFRFKWKMLLCKKLDCLKSKISSNVR